ncbi:MAG TPA: 3-hydroxyacyl-CoA dehydrogenase NAD-binding domain-containing protein [Candidatus Bathyarchaeia archaeon]|nr:3-hydroxyacyl-CoA dehydrogenase NAD-binding domain-containing protein [Candidatus Bathyarchaeia archaeon]
MEITRTAVVGAGTMGHGIAEIMALAGLSVNLTDAYPEALERAKGMIAESVQKLAKSGKIKDDDARKTLARISYVNDVADAVKSSDLVLEAVPEVLDLKRKVFASLEKHARRDAILATTTSNIRVSSISAGTRSPERIVGLHFFNPPVIMKLVEVIRGEETTSESFESAYDFARKLGKIPIKVLRDSAGFVVNRVIAPETLLLSLLLDRNMIASTAEVDNFARSQGLPMGPYELMDYVGLDTVLSSLEYFASELSPDYNHYARLKEMVSKGQLGRKTGKGFYEWKSGKAEVPKVEPTSKLELTDFLALEVNEAVKLIEEGAATPQDIETGVIRGMSRPFGPISVAQGLTNAEVKKKLEELTKMFGVQVFAPTASIREGKLREIISSTAPRAAIRAEAKVATAPADATRTSGEATGLITVDRPASRVARMTIANTKNNLIDRHVLAELKQSLDSLWNDKEVNVVILSGRGDNLSAGADVSQFFASGMDFAEVSRNGARIIRMLSEIPKVTIAEMKGYVLGAGLELSLNCDIRVATDDATIGFPEVTLGLVPGWTGSQRLSKLVGMSRALRYILSGERFSGREAYEMGLVSKVYGKENISEETVRFAEGIAKRVAPVSAALAKRLINKGSEVSTDNGLEMEAMAMGLLYSTEDLKEGVSAFLGKRQPEFKGK